MTALSAEHRQANRLHLAIEDMKDARRYITAYADFDSAIVEASRAATLKEALIVAAIVAYCRPFKRNNGEQFADSKVLFSDFDWLENNPGKKALHSLIIDKRDGFIAHADWRARSTEIVEMTPTKVVRTFSVPDLMEGLDVDAFGALALGVEEHCYYKAMAIQYRISNPGNFIA